MTLCKKIIGGMGKICFRISSLAYDPTSGIVLTREPALSGTAGN